MRRHYLMSLCMAKWVETSYSYLYYSLIPSTVDDVIIPNEYQEVEYIESSGTQYIDTGVLVNNSIRTTFDFQYNSLNSGYNRIFGTTSVSGSQYGVRGSTSTGGYFHGETISLNMDTDVLLETNKRYSLDFNYNNKFYINNVDCGTCSTSYVGSGTQNISLFRQTQNNTGSSIKLYSCKLYDNNVLIRNFIPCYRKSDNVIGLYDKVNNVFYTNSGTGTFSKGSDVHHYKTVKDSGKAKLATIYGNGRIENQLIDIKDSYTNTDKGITHTFSINKITLTGVPTSTYSNLLAPDCNVSVINGHKYFISMKIISNSNNQSIRFGTLNSNVLTSTISSGITSSIITCNLSVNSVMGFLGYTANTDIGTIVVELQLTDLTLMFGTGNEPTALTDNRIQSILNGPYREFNTGTYENTVVSEIEFEPYNLFDGELEIGTIDQTTGQNSSSTSTIRTINYIKVVGGFGYTINTTQNLNAIRVFEYDGNYNLLSTSVSYDTTHSYTLSNIVKYVRFVFAVNSVPSEQQICFHRTDTRTGYAPHTEPTKITLPALLELDGAINAKNTFEVTKSAFVFTRNVWKYTFSGSENIQLWQVNANQTSFYWVGQSVAGYEPSTTNLISNNFSNVQYGYIKTGTLGVGINGNNIAFGISTAQLPTQTAAAFKTWLSNNKTDIIFKLATPQVIRIPRKHLGVVDLGSLSWVYRSDYDKFYISQSNLKIPANTMNIYCDIYMTSEPALASTTQTNNTIATRSNQESYLYIKDTSTTDVNVLKAKLSGHYLFYECIDEVSDFTNKAKCERGGTIMTNEFSWKENQYASIFESPSGQFPANIYNSSTGTITFDDNTHTLQFTPDGTQSTAYSYKFNCLLPFYSLSVSKFFVIVKVKSPKSDNLKFKIGDGEAITSSFAANTWTTVYGFVSPTTTSGIGQFNLLLNDYTYTSSQTIEFRDLMIINLTQGFNAGDEPKSIDDPRIQRILKEGYIDYNILGTTKSLTTLTLCDLKMQLQVK